MKWSEWKSLWRFDKTVDIPHLSITVMCPYGFVRVLWYFNRREFQAWPSEYETSLVLGWRWPFAKEFKERAWRKLEKMPLAVYGGPMDEIYLARAVRELGWDTDNALESTVRMFDVKHIGPTIRAANQLTIAPKCEHPYWLASCPNCARRALTLAVQLKAKYGPVKMIDPHESPIEGFRRREAKARRLERERARALPEVTE